MEIIIGIIVLIVLSYITRITLLKNKYQDENKINYPLMEAVIEGDENKIKDMLKNIKDKNVLNNAFIKSIEKGNLNIINIFLNYKVSIPSLFYINFSNINLDILSILIKNGANINEKNAFGETLIHKYIYFGREDIINLLVKNGVNINEKNYDHGDTALIQQAYTGNKDNIKILLKYGASIDVKSLNGSTALIKASTNDKPENVKMLLENSANPNLIRNDGYTALMLSSYKGEIETVKLLLKYGADKNILSSSGNTAKDLAIQNNQYSIIELLNN